MSYRCEVVNETGSDRWNDLVRNAPQGTPFHLFEALQVLATYSNTTVYPLLVKKGEEPIGVFPVFGRSIGPVTAVFSPPPGLKVEYMGPVLMERTEMKVRRRERNLAKLVEHALDWIDSELHPRYMNVRTGTKFGDPRPFEWQGWEVVPRHTYIVDLTRESDELFMAFSSDARSNVRDAEEYGIDVYVDGSESIDRTIELVEARHAAQGLSYPVSSEFVRALYEALPDGVLKPYTCEADGEFVGGHIVLEHGNAQYVWIGTADREAPVAGNDVIDWYTMKAGMEAGMERYDLMGANTQQTASYKAKFAPDVDRYYRLERGSAPTRAVARAYKRFG